MRTLDEMDRIIKDAMQLVENPIQLQVNFMHGKVTVRSTSEKIDICVMPDGAVEYSRLNKQYDGVFHYKNYQEFTDDNGLIEEI